MTPRDSASLQHSRHAADHGRLGLVAAKVASHDLLVGTLQDVVRQRAELERVHLQGVGGLLGRPQLVHVPEKERERAGDEPLEPRRVHLAVEGVGGGECGASSRTEQPVPSTRDRAARRTPGAEATSRGGGAGQHRLRVGAGSAVTPGRRERAQERDVAFALVDPDDVLLKGRRAGEPAPHRPERLASEELVEPDRMSGGPGRQPQQHA